MICGEREHSDRTQWEQEIAPTTRNGPTSMAVATTVTTANLTIITLILIELDGVSAIAQSIAFEKLLIRLNNGKFWFFGAVF